MSLLCQAQVKESWVTEFRGVSRSGERSCAIAVDREGNVVVAGVMNDDHDLPGLVMFKYTLDGTQAWFEKGNPEVPFDRVSAMAIDHAGNICVAGTTSDPGTEKDFAIAKYDSIGGILWTARYDGPAHSNDIASAIAVDDGGNVYVTGSSVGTETYEDYATLKYSPRGQLMWAARYNGPGNGLDSATAIAVSAAGKVYVTGTSTGLRTGLDYATLCYDTGGALLWEERYAGWGRGDDVPVAVRLDSGADVYVSGWSEGFSSGSDFATLKYGPQGDQLWLARYDGPAARNDTATSLILDDSGSVYVTGPSQSAGGATEYAALKYSPDGILECAGRFGGEPHDGEDTSPGEIRLDGFRYLYAWDKCLPHLWRGYSLARSAAIDANGDLLVTALRHKQGDTITVVTAKYRAKNVPPPPPQAARQSEVTQNAGPNRYALKLFIDCGFCYEDFLKTELNTFDFVRDKDLADLHILVTTQSAANQGTEYTFAMIGLKSFAGMSDTLRFVTRKTDTDDMIQTGILKTLKMGLVRFVANTPMASQVTIAFPHSAVSPAPVRDAWNSWVFNTDLSAYFSGEKSTSAVSLTSTLSANRVTPDMKIRMGLSLTYNRNNYTYSGETISSIYRSEEFQGLAVRSLDDHWSAGIFGGGYSYTYNNISFAFGAAPAIEYSLYPYRESTRKQFTVQYRMGFNRFLYASETIYDRTAETLFDHVLLLTLDLKQPWGSTSVSVEGSQFFNDLSKNHLKFVGDISLRVVEGLSLRVSGNVSFIHDQVSLPKLGATLEEVLLARRQLETSYSYYITIGVSYTFGSIYSNVVNPRFGN